MSSLNTIILIGRLTQDPELRYTNSGTAVASFALAVERQHKTPSGEKETDFIQVVVWQKLGELVAQYLRKGRMAAVEGRLQIRQYENRDGHKVRAAEVVADNVRFLDRAPDAQGQGSTSATSRNAAPTAAPSGRSASSSRQAEAPSYDDPFADDTQYAQVDDLPF